MWFCAKTVECAKQLLKLCLNMNNVLSSESWDNIYFGGVKCLLLILSDKITDRNIVLN